jgi:hypothetical protein
MAAARITKTIVGFGDSMVVHVGHGTVMHIGHRTGVHVGDGAVRYVVKAAAVKAPRVNCPAVKSATMAAPTMSPSKGEVWLAERSTEQQSGYGSSQSPSYPGPGSIFA